MASVRSMKHVKPWVIALSLLWTSSSAMPIALAEDGPAIAAETSAPPPPPPPPPYSLPFQLRPVAPANVMRSDTTLAAFDGEGGGSTTVASTFLAAYKLSPRLAPLVRIAVVRGETASTVSNPLLGLIYGRPLSPAVKLGVFGAVTLPVGTGDAAANKFAIAARSSMDNALFAVNDHAIIGGADLAWVRGGFTAQAEVTLFQLSRVKNIDVQPDASKTNFTAGAHAGWFATRWLSVGAELRYQRWLSTPRAVAMDATGASRDNLTAAAGVRGHLELPGKRWLRPGIAYARPLDDPMQGKGYDIVQLDVPFVF